MSLWVTLQNRIQHLKNGGLQYLPFKVVFVQVLLGVRRGTVRYFAYFHRDVFQKLIFDGKSTSCHVMSLFWVQTDDSTDRLDFDAPDCNDDCHDLQPHPHQQISQIFGKLS